MAEDKVTLTLELKQDHVEWLNSIVDQHNFPDQSKAVRVLFDYAIKDADNELIFARENARCRHCG